jgi:holin-like protein
MLKLCWIVGRRRLRQSLCLQILSILIAWWTIPPIAKLIPGHIPSAIFGFGTLLALLAARWISPVTLRRGASWFLAEMMLFFVPAIVSLLDHRELFGSVGLRILIVIALSTLAVMTTTALTVDLAYRLRVAHDQR